MHLLELILTQPQELRTGWSTDLASSYSDTFPR